MKVNDYTHRTDILNACNTATPSSLGCAGVCASLTSRISKVLLMCSLASQVGCATDKRLAPPVDSEMVTVQVVLPPELMPQPLSITYRSAKCLLARRDASLERYEVEDYNGYRGEWTHDPQTGTYEIRVARTGGGACEWQLNNFWTFLTYTDTAQFGEGLEAGVGAQIKVRFDRPDESSWVKNVVDGDVRRHSDIYPWIRESRTLGNILELVGGGFEYYAPDASLIRYEVSFYREWLAKRVSGKKKGDPHTYFYPDGSIVRSSSSAPGLLKLQASRTGREVDCFNTTNYDHCPDRRPELSPYSIAVPNMPGHRYHVIVDEWGNRLTGPIRYRIWGSDNKVYEGMRQSKGYTQSIPDTALPFLRVEFPSRR